MGLTVSNEQLSHVFHTEQLPDLQAVEDYLNSLKGIKLPTNDANGYPVVAVVQQVEQFQIFERATATTNGADNACSYDLVALCGVLVQ